MSRPRRRAQLLRMLGATLLVFQVSLLAACGASTSVSGSATSTTTALSPTVPATATSTATAIAGPAVAWVQNDAGNVPQVWASVAGHAAVQITHRAADASCTDFELGPPVFAPDMQHIAVATGAGCSDGPNSGALAVVSVASGSIALVPPGSNKSLYTLRRSFGWVDSSTLWLFSLATDSANAYEYTLGASALTPLPGIIGAVDGVLRGTRLFYLQPVDSGTGSVQARIHSYDMKTHSVATATYDAGSFNLSDGPATIDYHFQGWDISPDGAHIVYQHTTGGTPDPTDPEAGVASSSIIYASVVTSGSPGAGSPILAALATHHRLFIRLSPNGQFVAATDAEGHSNIYSGCVSSPGTSGDTCFHAYSGEGHGYPGWAADSGSFYASSSLFTTSGATRLARYTPGHASGDTVGSAGYNPWTTP